MKQYNTQPISKALETAKTVLILLPENPTLDATAAALSLYLSFTTQQFKTSIGCSTPMTVSFNRLFSIDKIKSNIGSQNLVISFQYPEDSLEKVSYDKDPNNQKFHLTIEPKAGFSPLDSQSVEFSYTGSNADLVFVIGAKDIKDLGALYEQEKNLLEDKQKTLVNLSSADKNTQFGTVNLFDPTSAGCSEITLTTLKLLNLPLSADIATNLLAGIESATNNLSQASSPETYETVAELIRLGAKKGHIPSNPSSFTNSTPRPFPSIRKSSTPSWPSPSQLQPTPSNPLNPQPQSLRSYPPPQPLTPFQSTPSTQPTLINNSEMNIPETTKHGTQGAPVSTSQGGNAPQPDWLKPKVLTSSGGKT